MPTINYMAREASFKIVYCGAPSAGKGTCVRHLADVYPQPPRGKIMHVVTPHPAELALDFLPPNLGAVKGFSSRLFVSTLTGPDVDESAWQAKVKDVDAIVFVVDSQRARMDANLAAWAELQRHLVALGVDPKLVPIAFLYNKRDLAYPVPIAELEGALNAAKHPFAEGVATAGTGVAMTLKEAFKPALFAFRDRAERDSKKSVEAPAPAPARAPLPPPISDRAKPVDIAIELDKTMLVFVVSGGGIEDRRLRFTRHALSLGRSLPTLSIGSSAADVDLASSVAQPNHAELVEREGKLELVPHAHAEGESRVNGAPVHVATPVAVGDVVTLADRTITIELFVPIVPPDFEIVERDFVAPIRSDPSDVGTRLVYADWLEDHGALVRAEHLRIQVRYVLGTALEGDAEAGRRIKAKLAPATAWTRAIGWPRLASACPGGAPDCPMLASPSDKPSACGKCGRAISAGRS